MLLVLVISAYKTQDVVAAKTPELSRVEKASKAASKKILTKKKNKPAAAASTLYRGSDRFDLCDGFGNRKFDNISTDIQNTKALGFLWWRPLGDVFAQEIVEKNGTYDFSVPDKVVKEMQAAGIKIFGNLFPTGIPKIPNSIDTISFAKYVKAIVGHYKGQITYWQVGIEPFCSTPGDTCYKNFLN